MEIIAILILGLTIGLLLFTAGLVGMVAAMRAPRVTRRITVRHTYRIGQ